MSSACVAYLNRRIMVELALRLLARTSDSMTDSRSVCEPGLEWRSRLPALTGSVILLRELHQNDAASLHEALSVPEVQRALSIAPLGDGPAGISHYIETAHLERAAGQRFCFGVVPRGCDMAVGLFEVRAMETGFHRAEWRAAIAPEFWGSGVFADGARLVLDFLFGTIGARRLEARAAVTNLRAAGALMKVGAIREALLRAPCTQSGSGREQALWTILAEDRTLDAADGVH